MNISKMRTWFMLPAILALGVLAALLVASQGSGMTSVQAQDGSSPAAPESRLTISGYVHYAGDSVPLPPGAPSYNLALPSPNDGVVGPGGRQVTGATEVITDGHVTKPQGVATLEAWTREGHVLETYEIRRTILLVGDGEELPTHDGAYHVILHMSEGGNHHKYHDWDVLPGYKYRWKITARFSDGVVESKTYEGVVKHVDWLSARSVEEGVRLFFQPYTEPDQVDVTYVTRRPAGAPATAPVQTWEEYSDDHGFKPPSTILDPAVSRGEFYEYYMEYRLPPRRGALQGQAVAESGVVIAKAGSHTPSSPGAFGLRFAPDVTPHVVALTWGESTLNNSQVAYYKVQRKTVSTTMTEVEAVGIDWETVATTRRYSYNDWGVVDGEMYLYRVIPVDFHGNDADSTPVFRVGLLVIQCDPGNGRAEVDVVGFGLSPSRGNTSITDNAGTIGPDLAMVDGYPIGRALDGSLVRCLNFDYRDYMVQRRAVYEHRVAEHCPVDPGTGRRWSCDTVGGQSDGSALTRLRPIHSSEVADYSRPSAPMDLVIHWPLSLKDGLHRYEYQLCTVGSPRVCSPSMRTHHQMVGTTYIPFLGD